MLRAFRLPAVLLPLCLFLACSDGATAPEEVRAEGIYTLRTVGGKSQPFGTWQFGEYRGEVASGWITLRADRTFTRVLLLREPATGEFTMLLPNSGTYVQNGTELRFLYVDAVGEETGSVGGSRLTIHTQGTPFVFER